MSPYLSVIIPAYNEERNLPTTLTDINRHLSTVTYSYEIIVVNDGSKDSTEEVVKEHSKIIKNLRLISQENTGKGGAVKKGMLEASGDFRCFTDADNSTSIDHFEKMIPYFNEGYDVVIGSRDIKGAKLLPPQPWHRRVGGDIGNFIIQVLLLPGIWDTQCGFKAFTKRAAENIFPFIRINQWGFDVEVLSLSKTFGYRIKEIPVVWVNDPSSHVKPMAYLHVLLEVVKVRYWLSMDKYNIKLKSGESSLEGR